MPQSPDNSVGGKAGTKLQERTTRRKFLENAIKVAAVYGVASVVNDDLLNRSGLLRQAWNVLPVRDKRSNSPNQEITTDQSVTSQETAPKETDSIITDIEQRLGIRLLPLREAYELNDMQFNELDRKEFADVLPMRWDYERAAMVEKFYGFLPKFFHEPDGNGNPLVLTLTNFAEGINAAGVYMTGSPLNLLRLDYDAFSPQNEKYAFEVLTHESIHHMQDLGYSRLDQQIPMIFQKDIREFCRDTIATLDTIPISQNQDEEYLFSLLLFGVQHVVGQTNSKEPRSDTSELEAILGQYYIRGREKFVTTLSKIYGEKANDLYAYMRDSIFGGEEYSVFPLE